jgi:hypothetical protein
MTDDDHARSPAIDNDIQSCDRIERIDLVLDLLGAQAEVDPSDHTTSVERTAMRTTAAWDGVPTRAVSEQI